MNQMMMNNTMINQVNQNHIFQTIQKNNEQIIQMIQQILQVQMLNNMLLNQIINNNLNNNNINNNQMFNDMMNKMDNIINNMNMIYNPNKNIMNNNIMNNNIMNNNIRNNNIMNNIQKNENDPWAGNNAPRLNIKFETTQGIVTNLVAPDNISVVELIEAYFQRCHITNPERQNRFQFISNAKILNRADHSALKERFFDFHPHIIVEEISN